MSLYTPVIPPSKPPVSRTKSGSSSSLASTSTSSSKTVRTHSGYFAHLAQRHLALAALPNELDPARFETTEGSKTIEKNIRAAVNYAKGDTSHGKWRFVRDKCRLGCTRGSYVGIGVKRKRDELEGEDEIKEIRESIPDSEEVWLEWEEQAKQRQEQRVQELRRRKEWEALEAERQSEEPTSAPEEEELSPRTLKHRKVQRRVEKWQALFPESQLQDPHLATITLTDSQLDARDKVELPLANSQAPASKPVKPSRTEMLNRILSKRTSFVRHDGTPSVPLGWKVVKSTSQETVAGTAGASGLGTKRWRTADGQKVKMVPLSDDDDIMEVDNPDGLFPTSSKGKAREVTAKADKASGSMPNQDMRLSDLSEQSFLPPSFPPELHASTPRKALHKPAPIRPLSSSPPPAINDMQPGGSDTSSQPVTLKEQNKSCERRPLTPPSDDPSDRPTQSRVRATPKLLRKLPTASDAPVPETQVDDAEPSSQSTVPLSQQRRTFGEEDSISGIALSTPPRSRSRSSSPEELELINAWPPPPPYYEPPRTPISRKKTPNLNLLLASAEAKKKLKAKPIKGKLRILERGMRGDTEVTRSDAEGQKTEKSKGSDQVQLQGIREEAEEISIGPMPTIRMVPPSPNRSQRGSSSQPQAQPFSSPKGLTQKLAARMIPSSPTRSQPVSSQSQPQSFSSPTGLTQNLAAFKPDAVSTQRQANVGEGASGGFQSQPLLSHPGFTQNGLVFEPAITSTQKPVPVEPGSGIDVSVEPAPSTFEVSQQPDASKMGITSSQQPGSSAQLQPHQISPAPADTADPPKDMNSGPSSQPLSSPPSLARQPSALRPTQTSSGDALSFLHRYESQFELEERVGRVDALLEKDVDFDMWLKDPESQSDEGQSVSLGVGSQPLGTQSQKI